MLEIGEHHRDQKGGSGHLGEYASVLALPGTLEGHNLEDAVSSAELWKMVFEH